VEDDDGLLAASSAEVAETVYTAFTSTRQPLDQQALPVPVWRHHAVLTDRNEPLLDVEREHRRHAVVEQSIAELKGGPLAHLPSVIRAARRLSLSCMKGGEGSVQRADPGSLRPVRRRLGSLGGEQLLDGDIAGRVA